jgi:CRP/FNR family cyclic AMP-dependent transcriptional regulator
MDSIFAALGGYLSSLTTVHGAVIAVSSFAGLTLVIAASFARTMVRLRTLTVLGNACLLVGAITTPNPVSVVLFLILLPLNAWRLREIVQLTRKVEAAAIGGDTSGIWLKPYMKARKHAAGTWLFRKGDEAASIYLLVEGTLELPEIDKNQPAGELFGEVSFFSPDHRRTVSARCATECLVMSMSGTTFRQLYFQNPQFAFTVAGLIAQRLSADIQRLRAQVDQIEALRQK